MASSWPEVLVRTPVWWGYCPVKRLERETQHSESTTNAWEYDAPVRFICRAERIVWTRSIEKSSISTMTTLGRCPRFAAERSALGRPATWRGAEEPTAPVVAPVAAAQAVRAAVRATP